MPAFDWLMRRLLDPGRSMWTYIGRVFVISLTGSLLIALAITFLFSNFGDPRLPEFEVNLDNFSAIAIALVLFAPAVETAIMFPVVLLCRLLTHNPVHVALVSGLFWGVLHAVFNGTSNGVVTAWGFFVLTIALQVALAISFWRAYLVPFLIHALNNSFVVIGVLAFSE